MRFAILVRVVALALATTATAAANSKDDQGGSAAAIWDFVVVGAGTGGALCAARLAEAGATVLLVDAGIWDPPWIYDATAKQRDRTENVWGYPTKFPPYLFMQNSAHQRFLVVAGKVLGGSSTVHQDIYNRPPTREYEYLGFDRWSESAVSSAFAKIEADMSINWMGENADDLPDAHYVILEKLVTNLGLRYRHRPHEDGSAGGASVGWYMYRSCPQGHAGGSNWGKRRVGCRRHSSYSNLVAERNATSSSNGSSLVTTLTDALVTRVLLEGTTAVGIEVLRHGRLHEAFAARAVVLAAGAVGTPKILTLSGIGDPLEMQRLGVPVKVVNREVGQGLSDHLATFSWFLVKPDNATILEGAVCENREFFNTFFNLTGRQDGDGRVDAEVRYYGGCNKTRGTIDFGIEAVLLQPESRGRVVVTSKDPQIMPTTEFPSLWERDYERLEQILGRVADALGLRPDDLSASSGMSVGESVRKESYFYQHLCCSARAAKDGEAGVCDQRLRVRGVEGLYVSDASGLPALPSSHTSAAALLAAQFASEDAVLHAVPRVLPERAMKSAGAREALLSSEEMGDAEPAVPTVPLPLRALKGEQVRLPIAGLGTGTMRVERVTAAVAGFLRLGGRHIDTAVMYENYAQIKAGIEASGVRDLSDLVVTFKMMPLGREQVSREIATALAGLNLKHLDIALLQWPGDITSGKLLRGAHLPKCVTIDESGTSWKQCREESYAALLEEQAAGRVRAVGVSNFAERHLDELEAAGHPVPAVHQLEMHPFWIDYELLVRHLNDGTQLMAYGCLGSKHGRAPWLRQQGFKKIAERKNATVAQVLYRWATHHGAAVITGGSSDAHLAENLNFLGFELESSDIEFMDSNPPENMKKMYGPLPTEIL